MDKEKQFLDLVARFPNNPMGHFSLGKCYLESRRLPEAITALEKATVLDATYAAAFVALAEAYTAMGDSEKAKATYQSALSTPHGKKDASLASDIERRMRDLG